MLSLTSKKVGIEPIFDSDYYNATTKLLKIPEYAKERCDNGIVKYLGADCDPSIEIGDHVIFSGYSGTTVGVDSELIIIVHSDFIKGRIESDFTLNGLFFKGKVDSNVLDTSIKDILSRANTINDQAEELLRLFARELNRVLIPAPYTEAIKEIRRSAMDQLGTRINIKKEDYIEQRDPLDERNR